MQATNPRQQVKHAVKPSLNALLTGLQGEVDAEDSVQVTPVRHRLMVGVPKQRRIAYISKLGQLDGQVLKIDLRALDFDLILHLNLVLYADPHQVAFHYDGVFGEL